MAQPQHRVSISIAGQRVDGWTEYEIISSMLEPVDQFTLTRPFDRTIHRLLQLDNKVKIKIDDVTILVGLIDSRKKHTTRDENTISIVGRSFVGRLVQESAPTVQYDGLDLVEVVKRLFAPWYTNVSLSNARNREVRRGKRHKSAAAGEALVVKVKKKTWQVEPGQARWKIANDLASEAGYMMWASADGEEIIIGKPDYRQAISGLIVAPGQGSPTQPTALELDFDESIADRFSLIMALGAGRGDLANYGASTVSRRDVVRNGPGIDGTGLDFNFPKRHILAERSLLNLEECTQYAQRDMDRRDFNKQIVTATMAAHGQIVSGATPLLYAPDTMLRVIDEEQDLPVDAPYLCFGCKYKCTREAGETTQLQLVPKGTVFAQ